MQEATPNQSLKSIQVAAILEPGLDRITQEVTPEERTVRVTFRLTKQEAELLEKYCNSVDRSRFIRAAIFNYPMPRPRTMLPQIDRETYLELARIGNNINQQSRSMNEAIKLGLPPIVGKKYLDLLEELKTAIAQIRLAIATRSDSTVEID